MQNGYYIPQEKILPLIYYILDKRGIIKLEQLVKKSGEQARIDVAKKMYIDRYAERIEAGATDINVKVLKTAIWKELQEIESNVFKILNDEN